MKRLAPLLVAGLLALVGAGTSAATESGCTAAQLSGDFSDIPGSAGAGQFYYALRLRNRSKATCFVSGLVGMQLLGKTGRKLPTRVSFAGRPGMLTAVLVTLKPGGYATATVHFTPTAPGPGEPVAKQCEPTAYRVRMTVPPARAGTVLAPVVPVTPVCQHGGMSVSTLVAGRKPPRIP